MTTRTRAAPDPCPACCRGRYCDARKDSCERYAEWRRRENQGADTVPVMADYAGGQACRWFVPRS